MTLTAQQSDLILTCSDCHNDFTFSPAEQKEYRDRGFTNQPKRCHKCRKKRRSANGEPCRGTVMSWDANKGYGFLKPIGLELGKDIFVHYKQILGDSGKRRNLVAGQYVEFFLLEGPKGPAAASVKIIDQVEA